MTIGDASAFGGPMYDIDGKPVAHVGGITKLEYFAVRLMSMDVLPSDIATEQRRDIAANPHNTPDKPTPRSVDEIIAERAVKRANALIRALNEKAEAANA